jgi:hypothetical protein
MFPLSSVAVFAACLLALGRAPAARAEVATGPFDRFVAAWMGVVGVIGADAEMEDEPAAAESFAAETDANTFTIDEENADREAGEEKAQRRRERRERDHGEGGRRHHRGGHGHGGHAHDAPPMRGPRHPGMGAGHMGHHPGGPAMHHHALRAFHEIIRRLGRIEEKLGIELSFQALAADMSLQELEHRLFERLGADARHDVVEYMQAAHVSATTLEPGLRDRIVRKAGARKS